MRVHHIILPHNIIALLKYNISGTMAVLTDIGLLFVLVSMGMSDIIAVSLSVIASSVVHYLICRYYVFRTFKRSFISAYIYFVSIVGLSVVLNMGLYLLLLSFVPLHFTILRALSIALVGIMSFMLNAHYNFGTLTPSK